MTKREKIENSAYMILGNIAFGFRVDNQMKKVVAINLKNVDQIATFRLSDGRLLFNESNMSRENTFKTQLIVERNMSRLVEGLEKWESIQKIG